MTLIDRRYSVAEGTAVKAPCRVATTANITLSGEQTIDGVAVVDGDRVLVKDQSTASENGIYTASTGNWSRARDWDGAFDVVTGTRIFVNLGTANARTEWVITTTGEITVDTTSVAMTVLGGTGSPFADGTVASPGAYFTNYPSYGWYKTASGIGISINGALAAEFLSTGMAVTGLGINAATAFTDPAIGDEFTAYDLSATTNKKITFANYLKVISGLTEDTSPDASADYVVTYDNSAISAKKVLLSALAALPTGYLHGLTLANNGSDATNDIDIAAGKCRSDDDTQDMVLAASLTKRLDAAWAVGTNQGGRDTGSIADGWWHKWLIKRTDTGVVDALYSTSPTSPTMPANYDKKRRIGSIYRTGGAIKAFKQYGDTILWVTPVRDVNVTNLSTSRVLYPLTVPTGFRIEPLFRHTVSHGSGAIVLIQSPDETDAAPSATDAPLFTAFVSTYIVDNYVPIITDTSGQIAARSHASNTTLILVTTGYRDHRGRTF